MNAIPVTFEADKNGYIIEALELHPERAIQKYARPVAGTRAGSFIHQLATLTIPEGYGTPQHRAAFTTGGHLALAAFRTAGVTIALQLGVLDRFARSAIPPHFVLNAARHIAQSAQTGNAAHREFGQAYDALLHHIMKTPQPSTIGTSLYNGIGLAFFQLDWAWDTYRNECIDREVDQLTRDVEWSRLLD